MLTSFRSPDPSPVIVSARLSRDRRERIGRFACGTRSLGFLCRRPAGYRTWFWGSRVHSELFVLGRLHTRLQAYTLERNKSWLARPAHFRGMESYAANGDW